MDVMGFLMDNMGAFSPFDIPVLLFSVLVAGLIGWSFARWGAGLVGTDARTLALWASASALGSGLVRSQLPLAVTLLALILLARGQEGSRQERVLVFSALMIGMGCGSGASLVVLAVALPYVLVVRWAFGAGRS